ncbi:MAG: hypothetical protein ACYCSF_08745 [Acidimicrobiales bacterium]
MPASLLPLANCHGHEDAVGINGAANARGELGGHVDLLNESNRHSNRIHPAARPLCLDAVHQLVLFPPRRMTGRAREKGEVRFSW